MIENTVQTFVEEIDFAELKFIEIVGKGAFGVVSRAQWKGIDVAVKHIETASERRAFATELKQLSRVCHPNIVTLYGACTKQPVCLVMEYAEGGSLYNVLHGAGPQIDYTLAHAMSWCLQCAYGVEYLHNMKPKALIHRDLKPPNLLLVQYGTLLKICDFGTACDLHTYMTNNKGSAAWMAPEVFEGSSYSEKCDVFSWGIILWEVLTRRKPFEEIGGPAFRIMWAVHNGRRPPLIADCPKSIETLMTKCWSSNPVERPSMPEIARVMSKLCQFLQGADEPLIYYNAPVTPPNPSFSTPQHTYKSAFSTRADIHDTVKKGEPVPLQPVTSPPQPVVVEESTASQRMTSAPASLAASRENLDKPFSRSSTPSTENQFHKRYSADLTNLELDIMTQGASNKSESICISRSDSELESLSARGHRRTGSHGSPLPAYNIANPVRGHRRTGSHGNSPLTSDVTQIPLTGAHALTLPHITTAPGNLGVIQQQEAGDNNRHHLRSFSWAPNVVNSKAPVYDPNKLTTENVALNLQFNALDHQLQPLAPCPTSVESMDIYQEHVGIAEEYVRVQMEIGLLTQRKKELTQELQQDEREHENSTRFIEEYSQLVAENEQLQQFYNNLRKQVEVIRRPHINNQSNHVDMRPT